MIIYGLHSLRSGGITSAVRNSSNSIPERLLKIHGRWKSDSAKDMYVEESLENRLQAREGDSHMKQTGMLVVSLRGVNFGFWSRLGCSGQSANILSRRGLV